VKLVTPDDVLRDLDADQRRAVTTESRLVAVIAGAGSGKTRVLTRRIAYRIAAGTADARHTLVLTFTREAAGELRRRLVGLGLRESVEAGTFHSVALGVLRQRWTDTDRPHLTVVNDRRRLVTHALGGDARRGIDEVVREIDWASARGLDAERYLARARREGRRPPIGIDRCAEALDGYRAIKRQRGVIDFDDLLASTAAEMRRDANFADAIRWRFRHVLVDEAQDLNPLQHQLIELLRSGNDDLFLVGDPAQAIYGFNGADPGLLVDVDERFPGIEVIRLPTNHRSTPEVVETGSHVLAASGQPAEVRSRRPPGVAVELVECDDESDEAARVVAVVGTVDHSLVRRGRVAVLVRTHAQAERLSRALVAARIAVRPSGAAVSTRSVAVRHAAALGSPSALRGWAHDTLDERDGEADAVATAEAVLRFLRDQPRGDGAAFRSWVATTDPFGDHDSAGLDVVTFHAAKGREWHTVVVTGVETGLSPHSSAVTKAAKAEEGRLLYVAITRATDRLVLTRARRRGGYSRALSPFVDGIVLEAQPSTPPPSGLVRRPSPDRALDDVREQLLAWRDEAARRAGVLPVELCADRDLAALARHRPTSVEDIVAVTTLGPLTAQRLADGLIRVTAGDDRRQSDRSTTTGA
jgi:DNA helicase-2/ATP-dependent DNA helicase PcrA